MAENDLKTQHQQLVSMKFKGMFIVGMFMITFVTTLNKQFSGQVVARLPFDPPGFTKGMTHYGLSGNDFRDCSITFAFLLCNISVAQYVKKLLSLEGPRIDSTQVMAQQYIK